MKTILMMMMKMKKTITNKKVRENISFILVICKMLKITQGIVFIKKIKINILTQAELRVTFKIKIKITNNQ